MSDEDGKVGDGKTGAVEPRWIDPGWAERVAYDEVTGLTDMMLELARGAMKEGRLDDAARKLLLAVRVRPDRIDVQRSLINLSLLWWSACDGLVGGREFRRGVHYVLSRELRLNGREAGEMVLAKAVERGEVDAIADNLQWARGYWVVLECMTEEFQFRSSKTVAEWLVAMLDCFGGEGDRDYGEVLQILKEEVMASRRGGMPYILLRGRSFLQYWVAFEEALGAVLYEVHASACGEVYKCAECESGDWWG